MTPGRTGGTGTDGKRPLKHSVMKRPTENSLIQHAFQMDPARVLRVIYFKKLTPDVFFSYRCRDCTAPDATFQCCFDFLLPTEMKKRNTRILEDSTNLENM